ncbi:MAG: diphthine--ammonia ligase, partial [Methanobrevibacter sp.]|nr:diphthine--ammonia ligase [Methanobrevibacter sp.]
MKSAVLFSGGKDSTMALNYAINQGDEIFALCAMISENDASYMFHVPNINYTELIAEALDIPIIISTTKGKKEEELKDLDELFINLKKIGVEAIYTGALYSQYQKLRIDSLCTKHDLKSIAPYWHVDEEEYMREVVDSGFKVIVTGVFAEGLDESWLGKVITHEAIDELKKIKSKININLAFEGGEA